MKFYIDASNIHAGGGKTILNDFISGALQADNIKFIFWIDERFTPSSASLNSSNIQFIKVKKLLRLTTQFKIKALSSANDLIIFFGNVPPFLNFASKTILLQSNRLVVENYSTAKMSFLSRIQINIQRIIFNFFKNNVHEIVVQSLSMKSLIQSNSNLKPKVTIAPFKNFNEEIVDNSNKEFIGKSFIYIASSEPYKNHATLIDSWVILAKENIYPKLYLTLEKNTVIYKQAVSLIKKYNLDIEILSNISREELITKFSLVQALIYPSKFEAYALPLVEANILGKDIIASELDYVRDMVDPVQSFNPESAMSISRAIKRYLDIKDKKTCIMTPINFINYLNK